MDRYVTGAVIRRLRESKHLTQEELAERIYVSGKAVSKWETGQGFPDISLLEPLAKALDISVIELLSGDDIRNRNRSFKMSRSLFYVCPVCGNVVQAAGEAVVSCCGITLTPCVPEPAEGEHAIHAERSDGELYVTIGHPMYREHYISFLAALSDRGVQLVKLYPEGGAEARFRIDGVERILACCNRHGLFSLALRGEKPRR